MKKLGKILYYVLAGGVALFAVGYLVYEIVWKDILDMTNIIRTLLIVATMILAIYRMASGKGGRRKKHSPKLFREHYGELIGNAFMEPNKTSKKFFDALEYYQYDQYAKLVEAMQSLAPLCTKNDERFAVTLFMALGYDGLRSYAKAAETYEKALLYKENSTAASNLGLCYQRLGDYEKAIDAYLYAIKIEPNNAYAYNNLAQIYIRKERYEDALVYAEKAIERKENLSQAYSAMAIACAMLDDENAFEEAARKYALYGGDKGSLVSMIKNMKA